MIRFQCPACNIILQGSDTQAGTKIPCPKCGQRLQIPRPPAKRNDNVFHGFRRRFLSMKGARGPGDALIHQCAAKVVGAGLETRCSPIEPHLHP